MAASDLIIFGAIGVAAFVFRNPIVDFFKSVSGGGDPLQETKEGGGLVTSLAETVIGKDTVILSKDEAFNEGGNAGVLANNLNSNLTLTPLPDDPLFGVNGFFTNLFGINKQATQNEIQKQSEQQGAALDIDEKQIAVTQLGTVGKKGKSAFLN